MKRLFLSLFLMLGILVPVCNVNATVNSLISKNIYSGNGSNTSFAYTFPIFQSSEIQIYTIDNLGNQVQVISNYSINTGTKIVTYPISGTPVPVGWQIILLRVEPLDQQLSLSNQGNIPAKSLENAYDKLTMISQQLSQVQNQSVIGSLTNNSPIQLPSSLPGNLLGWNSSGLLSNISNPSLVAQWTLNNADISYNTGNVSTVNNITASNFYGKLNGDINWPDVLSLLKSSNVNWNDTNSYALINSSGINWNNMSGVINTGAMNWSSINSIAKINYGSINWPSTNIFPTSSNGNVGIGSSIPGEALDINGTVRATSLILPNSVYNYGSSINTPVLQKSAIKFVYGITTSGGDGSSGQAITGLPFSSSTSYTLICASSGNNDTYICSVVNNSGSQATIYNSNTGGGAVWIAIGT